MSLSTNLLSDFRVLSIQSHVVYGYVGNKSAVFPLQVLGFEVDPINSVQFSTHTGYPYWSGQVLQQKDLVELFDGLKRNNLHKKYTHILTGYVKSESFLEKVYELIKEVKAVSPNALYVCDPVMGDNGKMYVPQELLPLYRDKITLIADIMTPNQFEAELLTGIKIKTESDALKAIEILHNRGIPTLVLSSTDLGNESLLIALASSRVNGTKQVVRLEIPKFPVSFIGTGDLFASLFLAWFTKTGGDVKTTFEKTVATLQHILKRTYDYALKQEGACNTPANYELRLIQSIRDIENPNSIIRATLMEVTEH